MNKNQLHHAGYWGKGDGNTLALLLLAVLAAGIIPVLHNASQPIPEVRPAIGNDISLPFHYAFAKNGLLEEAGSIEESTSPYWWLDSGAYLKIDGGVGMTIQGDLSVGDSWRHEYQATNATDTEGGLHPQNIFRLLSRQSFENVRTEAYFFIARDRSSQSPERNESNGLLLFSRYVNSDDLYYAGIRVDGTAVIKKKIGGEYFTLAQVPVFFGRYDRERSTNLIPRSEWLGIRLDSRTSSSSVMLTLYLDPKRTGIWSKQIEVIDDGVTFGGRAHTEAGKVGIRTDFMDVLFDDFRIISI